MVEAGHEMRRIYPDGYVLRALGKKDGGELRVEIQWLDQSGKPAHQPFYVPLNTAEEVFMMLAAFAGALRKEQEAPHPGQY